MGTDKALAFGFGKYLKDKSYDLIVCCNYSTPTGLVMIEYMRLHKIPYMIEGDGAFVKTGKVMAISAFARQSASTIPLTVPSVYGVAPELFASAPIVAPAILSGKTCV